MNNAKVKGIKINCYMSDSASKYMAARQQLRVEHPDKVFMPCMAH